MRMSSNKSFIFMSQRQRASLLQPPNADASQTHLLSGAWERHSAGTESPLPVGQRLRRYEADLCALPEHISPRHGGCPALLMIMEQACSDRRCHAIVVDRRRRMNTILPAPDALELVQLLPSPDE